MEDAESRVQEMTSAVEELQTLLKEASSGEIGLWLFVHDCLNNDCRKMCIASVFVALINKHF